MAENLAELMPVDAMPVARAPASLGDSVGLLGAGGPKHHSGMPTPESRRQAARDLAFVPSTASACASGSPRRTCAAPAFRPPPSTRDSGDRAWVTTRPVRKRRCCTASAFLLVASAAHSYVAPATGPLISGEEERARDWGRKLASAILTPTP